MAHTHLTGPGQGPGLGIPSSIPIFAVPVLVLVPVPCSVYEPLRLTSNSNICFTGYFFSQIFYMKSITNHFYDQFYKSLTRGYPTQAQQVTYIMTVEVKNRYAIIRFSTNFCIQFQITLKSMRRQCCGQIRSLIVQLDLRPMRRIELYTKVCYVSKVLELHVHAPGLPTQ